MRLIIPEESCDSENCIRADRGDPRADKGLECVGVATCIAIHESDPDRTEREGAAETLACMMHRARARRMHRARAPG